MIVVVIFKYINFEICKLLDIIVYVVKNMGNRQNRQVLGI